MTNPRVTVITHTGRKTKLCSDLVEQIEQFEMYKQADNFAGWLVKRFVCDGVSPRAAEAKALDILRNGNTGVIDVRFGREFGLFRNSY